jgi:hypothetical protein
MMAAANSRAILIGHDGSRRLPVEERLNSGTLRRRVIVPISNAVTSGI